MQSSHHDLMITSDSKVASSADVMTSALATCVLSIYMSYQNSIEQVHVNRSTPDLPKDLDNSFSQTRASPSHKHAYGLLVHRFELSKWEM